MMTFEASFIGSKVGSIGVAHACYTTVRAVDAAAARLALYESFEHIAQLTLRPMPATTVNR